MERGSKLSRLVVPSRRVILQASGNELLASRVIPAILRPIIRPLPYNFRLAAISRVNFDNAMQIQPPALFRPRPPSFRAIPLHIDATQDDSNASRDPRMELFPLEAVKLAGVKGIKLRIRAITMLFPRVVIQSSHRNGSIYFFREEILFFWRIE